MDVEKNISENNEEQLNKTSTDENIADAEPQPVTSNPQPVTEKEMEVHHHTHAAHGKKNWKSYFWEFLMLFLAVFCGFLAEYQLEHTIEHQREKKFIRSLINDVVADTVNLHQIINNRDIRAAKLDSLGHLLNSDSANSFTNDIYFLAAFLPRVTSLQFAATDGTFQQLKTGGLRLIRNKIVIDSMMKYEAVVKALISLNEQELAIIYVQRESAPNIFIGIELEKFSDADNIPIRTNLHPKLTPGYENSLNEFNYRLASLKNVNKGYRRESRKLLARAINLLQTLKKEYHLQIKR